jgi:DNA-binding transcriptional LysR family regulator
MRVFQQVVDEGGFAAAARKLDLAPAVVTRLVGDLERHLGVRLLQRTTRSQTLTPAGEAYLARVRAILADIDEADAIAHAHSREMSGTVRVLAPALIATHLVAPAAFEFQREHPEVVLDVHVQDPVDPQVEGYDLTLMRGDSTLHSGNVVRTIVQSQTVFCASPAYLERHGTPQTPQDLLGHHCLRVRTPGLRLRPMTLINPEDGDAELTIDAPVAMTCNQLDTLLRAAIEGVGICSQTEELLAPLVRAGQLRRVLAPWITARLSVVAALPSRKYMPARTRAFLDHLIAHARRTMALLQEGDARGRAGDAAQRSPDSRAFP